MLVLNIKTKQNKTHQAHPTTHTHTRILKPDNLISSQTRKHVYQSIFILHFNISKNGVSTRGVKNKQTDFS